jgi:hypothetical protein
MIFNIVVYTSAIWVVFNKKIHANLIKLCTNNTLKNKVCYLIH